MSIAYSLANHGARPQGPKHKLFRTAVFSALIVSLGGCASDNKRTAEGAGIGAGAGAAIGAIVGHQSGHEGAGALIGGAFGGGVGGLIGRRMDQQAKELKQVAETKRTDQGIVSKLKSDILFDTGEAALKPEADENLTKMAQILQKYPENVLTIKGYTDATGSITTNQKLSTARAEAVKNELVAHGFPTAAVMVAGMGPADPVASNATKQGRSQNRRVEIEIKADPSKVPTTSRQ